MDLRSIHSVPSDLGKACRYNCNQQKLFFLKQVMEMFNKKDKKYTLVIRLQ